jgi:hypothetical protein
MERRKHFPNSTELRRYIREVGGGTALLAFSGGKDSIAAWIAMEPHFDRIVPLYMYLIPDLEFVEEGLRYFEDRFGAKVLRYPHPSLYRQLRNLVFQPPERCEAIEKMNLPRYDYLDIWRDARARYGLEKCFGGLGTRAVDSPIRLMNLRKNGPINWTLRTYWAVYDWKIADVEAAIRRRGLKLPTEYRLFGRSFDGLDYRFLSPIKKHYPRDFEKILSWFPLADLELKRREYSARRAA